jgi:hypothetical protein
VANLSNISTCVCVYVYSTWWFSTLWLYRQRWTTCFRTQRILLIHFFIFIISSCCLMNSQSHCRPVLFYFSSPLIISNFFGFYPLSFFYGGERTMFFLFLLFFLITQIRAAAEEAERSNSYKRRRDWINIPSELGISFIVRKKRIKQGGDCCCCCSIALLRPSSHRASIQRTVHVIEICLWLYSNSLKRARYEIKTYDLTCIQWNVMKLLLLFPLPLFILFCCFSLFFSPRHDDRH